MTLEFVDPEAALMLSFIDGVSRHGHVPSVAEVDAFASGSTRHEPVPFGRLLGGGVFGELAKGLASASTRGETTLDWLQRLCWVTVEGVNDGDYVDASVRVSPVGRAALAAAEEGARDQEVADQIVLDGDDPIARARLIERLAALGEFSLVDRYFSADDLLSLLNRTEATRVLTGPGNTGGRLSGLKEAAEALVLTRPFELRVDHDDSFHDRFAIASSGAMHMIGTSVGGVGKRHSVMVEVKKGLVAERIRAAFDECWQAGESIAFREDAPSSSARESEATERSSPPDSD